VVTGLARPRVPGTPEFRALAARLRQALNGDGASE